MKTPWLPMLVGECRIELLKALRTPSFMLPTLFVPPCFYALFVFGMAFGGGRSAALSMMATYSVFCAMAPGLFGIGAGVAGERASGWLDVRLASSLPRWTFVAAKLALALAFALVSALMVFALAVLAGVSLTVAQWSGLLLTDAMTCLLFSSIGLGLSLLVNHTAVSAVCNAVFLPAAFLGGLWFPVQALHPALLFVAQALPTYHLGQLGLMASGALGAEGLSLHLGVAVGWLIATVSFALSALVRWAKV